jgi:hypothetical protein
VRIALRQHVNPDNLAAIWELQAGRLQRLLSDYWPQARTMAAACEPALVALADHPLNTSRRMILDLAGVTYLDSSVVYALV